jgi:hypothetical protein
LGGCPTFGAEGINDGEGIKVGADDDEGVDDGRRLGITL